MKRLEVDEVLLFGKHKGKTIRQVFSGLQPISPSDAFVLFTCYGSNELSNASEEHKIEGFIGDDDWRELASDGQHVLFRIQPQPQYIDWLVQNTVDLVVLPKDLITLQQEDVRVLSRIEEVTGYGSRDFLAHYRTHKYQFNPHTIKVAETKVSAWGERGLGVSDEELVEDSECDENHTDYDYDSGFRPACGSPSPCGCNYALERAC